MARLDDATSCSISSISWLPKCNWVSPILQSNHILFRSHFLYIKNATRSAARGPKTINGNSYGSTNTNTPAHVYTDNNPEENVNDHLSNSGGEVNNTPTNCGKFVPPSMHRSSMTTLAAGVRPEGCAPGCHPLVKTRTATWQKCPNPFQHLPPQKNSDRNVF